MTDAWRARSVVHALSRAVRYTGERERIREVASEAAGTGSPGSAVTGSENITAGSPKGIEGDKDGIEGGLGEEALISEDNGDETMGCSLAAAARGHIVGVSEFDDMSIVPSTWGRPLTTTTATDAADADAAAGAVPADARFGKAFRESLATRDPMPDEMLLCARFSGLQLSPLPSPSAQSSHASSPVTIAIAFPVKILTLR